MSISCRQRSKKAPKVRARQLQTLKVKLLGEEKGRRMLRRLSIDSGAVEPAEFELLGFQRVPQFEPARVLCTAPQGQKSLRKVAGREEDQT